MYHANTDQNKVEVAILILREVDCRSKSITRNKEAHFIMAKKSIHQKDISGIESTKSALTR